MYRWRVNTILCDNPYIPEKLEYYRLARSIHYGYAALAPDMLLYEAASDYLYERWQASM